MKNYIKKNSTVITIVISVLSLIITSVSSIYTFAQSNRTVVGFSCENPYLDRTTISIKDLDKNPKIAFYANCRITNLSNKKVSIEKVESLVTMKVNNHLSKKLTVSTVLLDDGNKTIKLPQLLDQGEQRLYTLKLLVPLDKSILDSLKTDNSGKIVEVHYTVENQYLKSSVEFTPTPTPEFTEVIDVSLSPIIFRLKTADDNYYTFSFKDTHLYFVK